MEDMFVRRELGWEKPHRTRAPRTAGDVSALLMSQLEPYGPQRPWEGRPGQLSSHSHWIL